MRNLTVAFLLIFMFCSISLNGKDAAEGSNRNSSSDSADSSLMGKVKNFFGFGGSSKKGQSSSKKQNSSSRKISGKTRQLNYNRSFRDTLWEERLKDWQKRHSAVPQSLPRATFKLNKQSSSRSFRSSHRSFRSTHSHRSRHVSHGRIHVRRRSRRR